jgi:hypothetical protein
VTRHRFDPFSFLVGAVAVAVAALVLLGDVSVRLVDLRVVGPVVVLAIGAALLLGGKRDDRPVVVPGPGDDDRSRHDGPSTDDPEGSDEPGPDEPGPDEPGPDEPLEPGGPGATDTLRIDREDG